MAGKRPDIANAVRAVARYSSAPKFVHWTAALGILRYLKHTLAVGITLERGTLAKLSLQMCMWILTMQVKQLTGCLFLGS